jgi:hypothetical protein
MLKHVEHTMTLCALKGLLKLSRHDLIASHYNTNFCEQCVKIALLEHQRFIHIPSSCTKLRQMAIM